MQRARPGQFISIVGSPQVRTAPLILAFSLGAPAASSGEKVLEFPATESARSFSPDESSLLSEISAAGIGLVLMGEDGNTPRCEMGLEEGSELSVLHDHGELRAPPRALPPRPRRDRAMARAASLAVYCMERGLSLSHIAVIAASPLDTAAPSRSSMRGTRPAGRLMPCSRHVRREGFRRRLRSFWLPVIGQVLP